MDESTYTQAIGETAEVPKSLWNEEETERQTQERLCSVSLYPIAGLFTFPSGETINIDENWRFSLIKTDTSVTSKTEELLKELEEVSVKVPNSLSVRKYLHRYDDMLDLVLGVCHLTRGCFPPSTELSLEVYHDPEIEDEYLTLYVRQKDYERDILEKIKAILSGYGERLADKSGWFLVTTDFQPPK